MAADGAPGGFTATLLEGDEAGGNGAPERAEAERLSPPESRRRSRGDSDDGEAMRQLDPNSLEGLCAQLQAASPAGNSAALALALARPRDKSGGSALPVPAVRAVVKNLQEEDIPRQAASLAEYKKRMKKTPSREDPDVSIWDSYTGRLSGVAANAACAVPGGRWTLGNDLALPARLDSYVEAGIAAPVASAAATPAAPQPPRFAGLFSPPSTTGSRRMPSAQLPEGPLRLPGALQPRVQPPALAPPQPQSAPADAGKVLCGQCGKTLARSSLVKHMRDKHGAEAAPPKAGKKQVKPKHPCGQKCADGAVCVESFSSRSDLARHQREARAHMTTDAQLATLRCTAAGCSHEEPKYARYLPRHYQRSAEQEGPDGPHAELNAAAQAARKAAARADGAADGGGAEHDGSGDDAAVDAPPDAGATM